jgi:hypothetical protein
MKTWNYLVEEMSFSQNAEILQDKLDDIGSGGWELISLILLPGPGTSKFLAIFKHPNPSQ